MRVLARSRAGIAVTRLLLGAVSISIVLCPHASAANPQLELDQYAHTAWPAREGLMGATQAIVQTADGYLWLGTEFGLVRFDGTRFATWNPPAGEHLPSIDIMSLLAARDGNLWIGTSDGLASFNNGRLTRYPGITGEPVFALLGDHEGAVWVGLRDRLCAIRHGNTECSDNHHLLGGVGVFSLFEDSENHLWAGEVASGLWRWNPGPPQRVLPGPFGRSQAIAPGNKAAKLIAIGDGNLWQVEGKKSEEYAIPGVRHPFARHILRDRKGALWIGTWQQGLLHVYEGKTTRFTHGDGLSSDSVTALFEDREGNIWVGTTNGIDQLREPVVSSISADQGLSGQAWSVLAARDGSLWIGTDDGLNRWRQGQMAIYRSPSEPNTSRSEMHGAPREITDAALPDNKIGSLFEDQGGRIWVTSRNGAAWFENGKFNRVGGRLPVGAASEIFSDRNKGVWISYPAYGLFHVVGGTVVESVSWPWSDGTDPRVSALTADPVQAGLWVGFKHDGIAWLAGHHVGPSFGNRNGLDMGRVWNLQMDHRGTLWAATEGGLGRIRDGRVAMLSARNGLPCDAIHWVIEDDAYSLWLYTACGVVRITRPELDAWASDATRSIRTTVFDDADGIRARALLSPYGPIVTKSQDGKLWFAHLDGVSAIDPRHVPFNPAPPPVHIEQVTADGERYDSGRDLRLPPRVRNLAINFTALSLVAPEKVRFRFKLEGQDENWREVVNQRRVEYSNLPPRSYRFRVMAANNSGVWNETGDALEFSIAPVYYQTAWFRGSSLAAFFVLLWAMFRYRLHRIARQFDARLEVRIEERTRIARELHDTLLQSFQAALIEFQAARNLFCKGREEAIPTIDSAISTAQGAIVEGRDAIQGLRNTAAPLSRLEDLLKTVGQELAGSQVLNGNRPALQVTVEGPAQALSPVLQDEIYQIGREVLRNAYRHASATRIEAEIRYDRGQFRLRIRDDGKGIDRNILKEGMVPGHFGLRGIRERATRMGGRLAIWSEAGAGTEVELAVPVRIAYATTPAARRFGLFGKHSEES